MRAMVRLQRFVYSAEWVHPSDVIGAILSVSEYVSRLRNERGLSVLSMRDVIVATIKAYEIVGVLALDNLSIRRCRSRRVDARSQWRL